MQKDRLNFTGLRHLWQRFDVRLSNCRELRQLVFLPLFPSRFSYVPGMACEKFLTKTEVKCSVLGHKSQLLKRTKFE